MLALSKPDAEVSRSLGAVTTARLMPVGPSRWRVLDRRGLAIGHLDAAPTPDGVRWRAQRYHAPTRSMRLLGEFWSAADAVDCLRFSR